MTPLLIKTVLATREENRNKLYMWVNNTLTKNGDALGVVVSLDDGEVYYMDTKAFVVVDPLLDEFSATALLLGE